MQNTPYWTQIQDGDADIDGKHYYFTNHAADGIVRVRRHPDGTQISFQICFEEGAALSGVRTVYPQYIGAKAIDYLRRNASVPASTAR